MRRATILLFAAASLSSFLVPTPAQSALVGRAESRVPMPCPRTSERAIPLCGSYARGDIPF